MVQRRSYHPEKIQQWSFWKLSVWISKQFRALMFFLLFHLNTNSGRRRATNEICQILLIGAHGGSQQLSTCQTMPASLHTFSRLGSLTLRQRFEPVWLGGSPVFSQGIVVPEEFRDMRTPTPLVLRQDNKIVEQHCTYLQTQPISSRQHNSQIAYTCRFSKTKVGKTSLQVSTTSQKFTNVGDFRKAWKQFLLSLCIAYKTNLRTQSCFNKQQFLQTRCQCQHFYWMQKSLIYIKASALRLLFLKFLKNLWVSRKNSETASLVYILTGNFTTDLWRKVDTYFIPPFLKVFLGNMMHECSIPTCDIKIYFNLLQFEALTL